MIVTIDGPAGAGKSSASRRLAQELGFHFLDTGAMYRAVTWAALQAGLDLHQTAVVAEFARQLQLQVRDDGIEVNGRDVTQEIRDRDVTRNVAPVADNPHVRAVLVDLQRRIAQQGNYVCEGRDQGTVAFPHAECKIFLTASPEHRARRRVRELQERQMPADFESILREQSLRDLGDETRAVGKLQKAPDAIEVLTDDLTLDEVVAKLVAIVRARQAGQSSP